MEINIGSGNLIVSGIGLNGKEGVRIASDENHGQKIDTRTSMDRAVKASSVCIIWFEDLKAARLFQDQVNMACLRLNGYDIANAEDDGAKENHGKEAM